MSTLPVTSTPRRTPEQVSEVMRAVTASSTEPEKLFRKALRRNGIRSFRVCDEGLPGKPDIVIPSRKLAIFIDGDFWHGNQYRVRGQLTLEQQLTKINNSAYWNRKIGNNVARDIKITSQLLDLEWNVARFWESEIHRDVEHCVKTVLGQNLNPEAVFSALPRKTASEFFAGIGLVRLAFKHAGWTTVFANDNDPQKIEMYTSNFGMNGLDSRSVDDLKGDDIPTCAIATASFPCNDLSLAGARRGLAGSHSGTFWAFIRILGEMGKRQPPLVLLENVPGFLTSHDGADFAAAIAALNKLGYSCDPFMIDAANFVPQSRTRLFIIGKQGCPRSDIAHIDETLRPRLLVDFVRKHSELGWSIRPLPQIKSSKPQLESILEKLGDDDPRWWSQHRAEYFLNQLSLPHLKLAKLMIRQDHATYATAFRRMRNERSTAELRFDGIAGCLRTPRGGSARQILFKAGCGKYKIRLLTPRECARLQGVPDDEFKIDVTDNRALFGFGDAVCVSVVEWIARNYLNPLVAELIRGRILNYA
ncbi:MAG TPA: DNA mismatch endonuclease Vsr [Candidatus Angelobacter sp.]|nr:DNA mismatch endonuclease Vsr [Candidatus Angelobacter sp.]